MNMAVKTPTRTLDATVMLFSPIFYLTQNPALQAIHSMFVLGIGYIEYSSSAAMVVLQPSVDWAETNPMDLCVITRYHIVQRQSWWKSRYHLQRHKPMGKRWDEST